VQYDEYLTCVGPCVAEGNFTNHGPFITKCEELLTHYLGKNYHIAIYGSSTIGTAVGIWLAGGLEKYEGSYSIAELYSLLELLDGSSGTPDIKRANNAIRIYKNVSLEDLPKRISVEVPVCVINGVFNTELELQYHSELNYSVLVLTDAEQYQEAVSMRSSYGAGDSVTNVIATLNGRPSELVGRSLLNVLERFDQKNQLIDNPKNRQEFCGTKFSTQLFS